jgi:threonine 3-dehydrogenase
MSANLKSSTIKRFLITGINGQVGRGIASELYNKFGAENVFGTDIRQPHKGYIKNFHILDITDKQKARQFIHENKINNIIHFATLRSQDCEENLELAKKLNIDGIHNILEISRETNSM